MKKTLAILVLIGLVAVPALADEGGQIVAWSFGLTNALHPTWSQLRSTAT
jgi:hypothetical protein